MGSKQMQELHIDHRNYHTSPGRDTGYSEHQGNFVCEDASLHTNGGYFRGRMNLGLAQQSIHGTLKGMAPIQMFIDGERSHPIN